MSNKFDSPNLFNHRSFNVGDPASKQRTQNNTQNEASRFITYLSILQSYESELRQLTYSTTTFIPHSISSSFLRFETRKLLAWEIYFVDSIAKIPNKFGIPIFIHHDKKKRNINL